MMKLLIVTQAVDTEDPVLGFFVGWITELSKHAEHVEVICLRRGRGDFPSNVRVHSLGKERGAARRGAYAWRFLRLAWQLRGSYDAVFIHMNQEYVLIAGWLWKLLGKRIYLWRNHYAGSWLTDIAASFCTKVFCTSKYSYTAKYGKTAFMPVGVDTGRFTANEHANRIPHSILSLGRISPSKHPELLINALAMLAEEGIGYSADIYGSPLPQDAAYYENLKKDVLVRGLGDHISFHAGVKNSETPTVYRSHALFVNTSPSGMLDKTIFEAAASGCRVFAASKDFAAYSPDSYFGSAAELAERLAVALANPSAPVPRNFVEEHSLKSLAEKLFGAILSTCRNHD